MAVTDITIAPATVYVGGTAPADGTWLTFDTNGVPQSATSTPMAGTSVGMTGGAATFSVDRKVREVNVQQALAPVAVKAISEEVSISFVIAENALAVIQKVIGGSTATDNASASPKYLGVAGTNSAVQPTAPLVLAVKDAVSGLYKGYLLYLAYVSDKIEVPFDNQKETMIKVTMKGLADTIRTSAVTGNVYQIVGQHA